MQIPRRFPDWEFPFAVTLILVVAAAWGDIAREFLRYDRLAIASGEVWRLLSGHFVHLGYQHLALNLAGLGLVWLLVGRRFGTRQWWLVTTITIVVTSTAFWFLDADMQWYVGLSGLLHGILVAGAIHGIRSLPWESVAICVVVAGKLGYEQFVGPLPGSALAAGGAIVVNAHLYGAAGGVLSAIVLYIMPTHSTLPDEENS